MLSRFFHLQEHEVGASLDLLAATIGACVLLRRAFFMELTQLCRTRLRVLSHEMTRLHKELPECMFTSIQPMRTIRSDGLESVEIERFSSLSRKTARVLVRAATVDHFFRLFQALAVLTPTRLQAHIDSVAGVAINTVSRPFVEAVRDVQAVARGLKELAGQARARWDHQKWLAFASTIGVMLGATLWFLLSGILPRSAGEWIAASMIGRSVGRPGRS